MKSKNKSLSGSILEKAGKSNEYCCILAPTEIGT